MEKDFSPTEILSDYIVNTKYSDIPEAVLNAAKHLILDSIACCIGASTSEQNRIVREVFSPLNGAAEATLMGTQEKVPLLHAVYVNAFSANILSFDDTYETLAHPGATVIPPALAVGEKMGASGAQVLTAVVTGYEVLLRIGYAIEPTPERQRQAYGLSWQSLGATITSGKLLNLDKERMRHALSLGGYNTPVPFDHKLGLEIEERPVSWIKNNFGWSAMGGVLGSLLAQKGFIGNRFILDGDKGFWAMTGSDQCDFSKMYAGLGETYLLPKTSIKPYAGCRFLHSPIDACLKILGENKLTADDIVSVTAETTTEIIEESSDSNPENIIDAQFSLPFLVALCIHGRSPAKGLHETDLANPTIRSTARKIILKTDDELDKLFWDDRSLIPCRVTIETKDGRRFEETVLKPKGSPESPLTEAEIEEKFISLTEPVIGIQKARRIMEKVKRLETVDDSSLLFAIDD